MHIAVSRRGREKGGGGGLAYWHKCRTWTLPLSPLWGFRPQILPQTAVLSTSKRDIWSNVNYFWVPRLGNLTPKMQKNSYAAPIPVPLLSVQTLIPALIQQRQLKYFRNEEHKTNGKRISKLADTIQTCPKWMMFLKEVPAGQFDK